MQLLIILSVALFVASSYATQDLPFEVETTLLDLLTKKELNHLDTSKRVVVPLYRKDLDPDYVAYYQISFHKKYYFVLSAGPKTGDYPEAVSGPVPLPTDVLREEAKKVGQECKKFFVLTSMGLYMCENENGRAVAATFNWLSDSPIIQWKNLQNMVNNSLANFKKEWEKRAVKAKEYWKTAQRKKAGEKPNLSNYDAEIVSPGSSATVALEKNHGQITVHAIPESRQGELCAILINVCASQKFAVNQGPIHKAKNGISYLEFKVNQDAKKILKNKEISFYFKIEKNGNKIIKYFSVDLSLIHRRGWSRWRYWSVRHENLFPDYNQHECCGCYSGCGPVAWAMIMGFYDRLAHMVPSSGYSKRFWSCSDGTANGCMAPKYMYYGVDDVKKYVVGIRKKLRTFCFFKGGATTPADMKRIVNWYRARGIGGRIYSHYHSLSFTGWTRAWIRDRAASHIKAGYPAIIGVWVKGSKKKAMHYPVATKLRERSRRYRSCFLFWCRTKTEYHKDFYLHMGWGGNENGWYRIRKAFAAFAARKY